MRIRSGRAQPGARRPTSGWTHSHSGLLLFTVVLAASLLAAGGIWYALRGYQLVHLPFGDLFGRDPAGKNGLPTVYVDLAIQDYQALAKQQLRALETGIVQPDDEAWREAQIRFQEAQIPVRVRLKGDEADRTHPGDHWQQDKWSFDVETRGATALLGMPSFSLQSPAARAYLNGWLYAEDLRRAGILAPRCTFVNVAVNGRDWGVYALEESPSGESLASQGRNEGIIIRPREGLFGGLGDEGVALPPSGDAAAATYELPVFAQIDVRYAGQDQGDAAVGEQAAAALGLLRAYQSQQLPAWQVFDAGLLGRYAAHADLWGASHGLAWYRERYYHNPLTARLEPVGYGGIPFVSPRAGLTNLAQYQDLAVLKAYAQEAARISQPEYLGELQAAYAGELSRYRVALGQEFLLEHLEPPWDALVERQALLRASLNPPQPVYASQSGVYQVGDGRRSTLDVQVYNVAHLPVVLHQVGVGENWTDVRPEWVVADKGAVSGRDALLYEEALPAVILRRTQGDLPRAITLRIPISTTGELIPSQTLRLATSLVGVGEQVIVDVQADDSLVLSGPLLPKQPSVEEALERYPFLAPSDLPGLLALRPGTWHVDGDLVLPDAVGLWATQAVTLTFDEQAMLFATGPLLLQSPDERIYFGPQNDHWAGLVVLHTGPEEVSTFYNVEIRGSRGVRRSGWTTTGGLTFYESPIVMNNCRVLDSLAADAVHVVHADFEFVDTEFGHAAGDAFDGDFVRGLVERCAIHDVEGNGIDVSGSDVTIQDTSLLRVYDSAILADRGSLVTARGLRAHDVGIATVSRDMSTVRAQDVHIAQAHIAGFAAYAEKAGYGPASIQASAVTFEDSSVPALVQNGSSVTIDGVAVPATQVDVAKLHRQKESPPPMHPLVRRLGPAIWLRGYEITTPEVAPGQRVEFILYWRALARPDRQYTVFVHILDASGEAVAGWDSMPRHNTLPTTDWPTETLIDDPHFVPLPQDLPPGEYSIALGMYYWGTGERLPVQTADGQEVPDARIVLDQTFTVR